MLSRFDQLTDEEQSWRVPCTAPPHPFLTSVIHYQAGIFEEPPGDLSAHGNKTGLWISLAMSFLHGCVYFMPTPSLHHTCM